MPERLETGELDGNETLENVEYTWELGETEVSTGSDEVLITVDLAWETVMIVVICSSTTTSVRVEGCETEGVEVSTIAGIETIVWEAIEESTVVGAEKLGTERVGSPETTGVKGSKVAGVDEGVSIEENISKVTGVDETEAEKVGTVKTEDSVTTGGYGSEETKVEKLTGETGTWSDLQ